jgi:hypothetical protein
MDFLIFGAIVLVVAVAFIIYLERRRSQTRHFTFYDGSETDAVFIPDSIIAKIFLKKRFVAFALWKYVFIKGLKLTPENEIHEARHVLQWRELGFVGFIRTYLSEHKRHGYSCNYLEEDARVAAGQATRCKT